nr:Protein D1069.1 [Haemonchus contortus]
MKSLRLPFGAVIVLAFLFTIIALFTPGWRSYSSKATHEKVTLGFVIVACILQGVAIGCFFTLFSERIRMGIPTAGICALSFLCLFIAIMVFGVRYKSKVAYMTSISYELIANVHLGYAYWLAVVGTLFTLLATVIAGGLIGSNPQSFE